MGDSQCRRIRPGMRGPSAHQYGFRIDPEGDGDQRQDSNDDNGSHGPICRARIRRNTGRHGLRKAAGAFLPGRLPMAASAASRRGRTLTHPNGCLGIKGDALYRLPVFLGPPKHNLHRPSAPPRAGAISFWGDCQPTSATLQWGMPRDPYIREKFTRLRITARKLAANTLSASRRTVTSRRLKAGDTFNRTT
jgi:hypothetical protein